MIDPKEPIGNIFAQYPSVKTLYDEKHQVENDAISTEAFCDEYDIPFFDFWMAVGREVKTIDAARQKENEVKTQDEANEDKRKRQESSFKTMDGGGKKFIICGLFALLVGALLVCLSFMISSLVSFFVGIIFVIVSIVAIIQGLTGKGIRKYRSFNEMTHDEQETMILLLTCLILGACLYFVSHLLGWSNIFKTIGIGMASYGSIKSSILFRKKD